MKLWYEVHYNKGDFLDYRSYLHYTLGTSVYADAKRIMEELQKEGITAVLTIKPYEEIDRVS